MRKREEKLDRKSYEREAKYHHNHPETSSGRSTRKVTNTEVTPAADFLSFNDVDAEKFTQKNRSGLELLQADSVDDIESRISKKYDRD